MWGSNSGQRRSRRPGSLVRSTVAAAGVIAAAVTVGLAGTGGTYALWNASATVPGATIRTGTVGLSVDPASLGTLATSLGPGGQTVTRLTVSNTGSTPLKVSATVSVSGGFAGSLSLGLASVADTTSCPTGSDTEATMVSGADPTGVTTLAGGQHQALCLVLTLADSAPAALAGTSGAFTLTFTGDQVSS